MKREDLPSLTAQPAAWRWWCEITVLPLAWGQVMGGTGKPGPFPVVAMVLCDTAVQHQFKSSCRSRGLHWCVAILLSLDYICVPAEPVFLLFRQGVFGETVFPPSVFPVSVLSSLSLRSPTSICSAEILLFANLCVLMLKGWISYTKQSTAIAQRRGENRQGNTGRAERLTITDSAWFGLDSQKLLLKQLALGPPKHCFVPDMRGCIWAEQDWTEWGQRIGSDSHLASF